MSKPRLFRYLSMGSILTTLVVGVMGMLFHYLPRQGVPDIVVAITLTSLAALFYAIRRWEIAEQRNQSREGELQHQLDMRLGAAAREWDTFINLNDAANQRRADAEYRLFRSLHLLATALKLKTKVTITDYLEPEKAGEGEEEAAA